MSELGEMRYMIEHDAKCNDVVCQSPLLRLKLKKFNTTSILQLDGTQLYH
jgi:hypothetical protein